MGKKPTPYTSRTRKKPATGPLSRHFLYAWREHRKLTQEELAEQIGMSHASVGRLENSIQPLTQTVLDKLALALQTTRGSILDRKPNAND